MGSEVSYLSHPEQQDAIRSSAHPLDDNNISFVGGHPTFLEWYIRPVQNLTGGPNYDELVDKLVINHGWNIQDFDILKDRAELLMKNNRQVLGKHQDVYQNTSTTNGKIGVPLFSTEDNKPLGKGKNFQTKEAAHDNYLERDNDYFTGSDNYLLEKQAVDKSNLNNQDLIWWDSIFFVRKKQVVSESLSDNVRVRRTLKVVKEKINDKSFKVDHVDLQRNYTFSSKSVAKLEKAFNIKASQNSSHPTTKKRIVNIQGNSVRDVNIYYNNCKSIKAHKLKLVSQQPLEMEFPNHSDKLKRFKELDFNNNTLVKNVASQNGDLIQNTLKIALNDTNLNSKKSTTLKETNLDRQEGYSSAFDQQSQNNVNGSSAVSDTKENVSHTIKLYSVNRQSLKSKISEVMDTKEQGLEVHHSNLFTDTNVEQNRVKAYITSTNLLKRNKEDKMINKATDKPQQLPKSLNKNSLTFIQVMEIMKVLRSPKLLTSDSISNSQNAVSHSKGESEYYSHSLIKDYKPIVKVKTTQNDETLKIQKMFYDYIKQAFSDLIYNVQKRSKIQPDILSRDSPQRILDIHEADSEENADINMLFVKDQLEQIGLEPSNDDSELPEPLTTTEGSLISQYEELSNKITTSLNTSNNETGEEHLIDSLNLDYNVFVDDVQDKRLEYWALKYNLYPEITKYLNSMEPIKSNHFQEVTSSQRSLKFSGVPQIGNTNFSNNKTQIKLPVKHRSEYVSRKSYYLKNSYPRRLKLNQRLKRVRDIYLRTYKNGTDEY